MLGKARFHLSSMIGTNARRGQLRLFIADRPAAAADTISNTEGIYP
jgi:hypothetical protein